MPLSASWFIRTSLPTMSEGILSVLLDTRRARRNGLAAIAQRQRDRLSEMVAFARANSPYYHGLYEHLPQRVQDPAMLPVVGKQTLMLHFDDWVTDREVTIETVRAFVNSPDLVGERFLGKYSVATTSGTTGTPGIFLLDQRSWAVTLAFSLRMMMGWLNVADILGILASGGRMALVQATGGHFIGATGIAAIRKRRLARSIRAFPVQMPLPDMIAELNQFRPVLLAGYASVMVLLAEAAFRFNPCWSSPLPKDFPRTDTTGSREHSMPTSEPLTWPQSAFSWRSAASTAGITSTVTGLCSSQSMPTTAPFGRVKNPIRSLSATSPIGYSRFSVMSWATASYCAPIPVSAATRCRRSACGAAAPTCLLSQRSAASEFLFRRWHSRWITFRA
jgi:hypothetical protein